MRVVIGDDEMLDQASERLDELRREISRRVIDCHRTGVLSGEDVELRDLRKEATSILAAISHYEMFGPDSVN